MKPLNLLAAAICLTAVMNGASTAATLQVEVQSSSGKPLADAVVFLESREAKALAKPLAGAEIAQVSKQFLPQVSVVTTGTSVQFPNRDTVRHHVYSFSPIKTFDLKLYTGTPANPVVFERPGIAVLGCNIHDTMAAWVVVVDTPYFGRTPSAGRVTLDNVPQGNYRLRTWHPDLPVGSPAADQALVLNSPLQTLTLKLAGVGP
jgi:plastocyanin